MAAGETLLSSIGLGPGAAHGNVAKIAIEQRKKKTEALEPAVISEDLLVAGAVEPAKAEGEVVDPIEFPQVTSMRLSFLNIIEISNLNNFDSLLTLRLDNNIIDRIDNLGHLKQLTWLDLSFNNIREIEGLENLSSLLDLSLYHNQIERIEGLEGCPKLNILSLGQNSIKELKQIDYLRRFQNLRCLCLHGNKVCQFDTYNQHVLAYLPMLKYLDYMLIDRKAVTAAQEGYGADKLGEIKDREQAEAAKEKTRRDKEAVLEKLRASFLDVTEDLFEELFSKALEPECLTALACFAQLKEDMEDKLAEDVKSLRAWMEERSEVRQRKVAAFEKAIATAEKYSEDEAEHLLKDFRTLKKKVLAHIEREEGLKPEAEAMAAELLKQLGGLESQLMANEIQLQEGVEEAMSEFEGKIENMIKGMGDKGREFFSRLEELERIFFTSLTEGMVAELEAFAQNQDSLSDADSQKARFFGNREEMAAACTNFNEAHMSLIQNKDDGMQNAMTGWRSQFFERHRERQYHRNRQRITEVKRVVDECRAEITAAIEAGEDYDEHENGGDGPLYGR